MLLFVQFLKARNNLKNIVNSTIVHTYWHIGKVIVEDEQKGSIRANYGKQQIKELSHHLTAEFGKGFDERNLRNMRAFYLSYPKWNALRSELSWTHYRILMRLENQEARKWYEKETIENNWSSRALKRQISTLYYERLLSSTNKKPVIDEAIAHTDSFVNVRY